MKASSFFSTRLALRKVKLLSLHFITGKAFLVSFESQVPKKSVTVNSDSRTLLFSALCCAVETEQK